MHLILADSIKQTFLIKNIFLELKKSPKIKTTGKNEVFFRS